MLRDREEDKNTEWRKRRITTFNALNKMLP